MINIGNIFIVGSIFFSFLTCIILFARKSDWLFANRLLSLAFFGLIWYSFRGILDYTGWIRHVPGVLGFGIPVFYATPAFGYLYIRVTLNRQTRFTPSDWLHFLPAIIGFITVIPFYMESEVTKQRLADSIVQNYYNLFNLKFGLLSNLSHFKIRSVQGIFYALLQWRLLSPILKRGQQKVPVTIQLWLIIFTVLLTLAYTNQLIIYLIGIQHLSPHENMFNAVRVPYMVGSVIFLLLSVYLFFFPEILYGVTPSNTAGGTRLRIEESVTEELEKEKKSFLSDESMLYYAKLIETRMAKNEIFRWQGITVNDLAKELDISPRIISTVVNQHYKQGFRDFINSYRINYLIDRFTKNNWSQLSLEGLSQEAGFASRTAFFMAFKKHTGLNPTEYLQNLSGDKATPPAGRAANGV